MKHGIFLILLISGIIFLGCSQAVVTPDSPSDIPSAQRSTDSNRWSWGQYKIRISADRTEAELIPVRNSSWHLNVTKFVEGFPCPDCLKIGNPIPQPDGTFKIKTWLSHPFPSHPEYTGFDVRGILVFQATDKVVCKMPEVMDNERNLLMEDLLINYSDAGKGGAGLLNADGYTFYLNPLLDFSQYEWPEIFDYSPGEHSVGEPDCTLNPYILYADESPRRMFKTTDSYFRTFHIQPPAGGGAFEFGYVVSACWAMPTVMPVTDPENDFPIDANCEDPWKITVEQLQPITYGIANQTIFTVTFKHRPETLLWAAHILVPTLSSDEDYYPDEGVITWHSEYDDPVIVDYIDAETTEIGMHIPPVYMEAIGDGLIPGWHLGFLVSWSVSPEFNEMPPQQLWQTQGLWPVMVYAEV